MLVASNQLTGMVEAQAQLVQRNDPDQEHPDALLQLNVVVVTIGLRTSRINPPTSHTSIVWLLHQKGNSQRAGIAFSFASLPFPATWSASCS